MVLWKGEISEGEENSPKLVKMPADPDKQPSDEKIKVITQKIGMKVPEL